jgi:hypothetical protein
MGMLGLYGKPSVSPSSCSLYDINIAHLFDSPNPPADLQWRQIKEKTKHGNA